MTEDKASEEAAPGGAADPDGPGPDSAAQRIISAFGGIRPMAGKLGVAVSTVQGWRERGAIPAARRAQIRAAAESQGIALDEADLKAGDTRAEKPAGRARARKKAAAKPAPIIEAEPVEPGEEIQPEPAAEPAAPGPIIEAEPVEPLEAQAAEPDEPVEPPEIERVERVEPDEPAGAEASPVTEDPPGDDRFEAPPAAPPARPLPWRWLPGFALGAVVMALGFGGAVLSVDLWGPDDGSGAGKDSSAAALAALEQRFEQDLTSLRDDLEGRAGALADQVESLASEARALEAMVADLPEGTAAPAGPDPATLRKLEDLTARLDALGRSLQKLEQQGGAPALSEDQLAALGEADRTLASRFANLEARLGEVDGLEGDLGALEQSLADLAARVGPRDTATGGEMAMVLAVIQLRDAARGPAPYLVELELLAGLAAGDGPLTALLAPLGPRAASGLPTLAGLTRAFPAVAGAIVAGGAGEESDGLMSGVLRRLSDVVSVRPLGDVEGSGPGAIAARAEHRLRGGDLAGAVVELDGLTGLAAEAAAAWRAEAEARLAADAALAALGARVIARLAPAGG